MTGQIYEFDARPGGTYRMALTYRRDHPNAGKTSEDTDADSDEVARGFRCYLARYSDLTSPTVPISNRPGTRWFQHNDFVASAAVVGQPFWACLDRVRRMLSPVSSMRWALWTRRSRIASA